MWRRKTCRTRSSSIATRSISVPLWWTSSNAEEIVLHCSWSSTFTRSPEENIDDKQCFSSTICSCLSKNYIMIINSKKQNNGQFDEHNTSWSRRSSLWRTDNGGFSSSSLLMLLKQQSADSSQKWFFSSIITFFLSFQRCGQREEIQRLLQLL